MPSPPMSSIVPAQILHSGHHHGNWNSKPLMLPAPNNGKDRNLESIRHSETPSSSFFPMIPSSVIYSSPSLIKHYGDGKRRTKGSMPSNRTISDFAFDPYAGFMSKREREWLIKIHMIQCTTTGDMVEDDYYYTMWKKQHGLNRPPIDWKHRPKWRYYPVEETHSSSSYTAPSFLGSLGKPTHSSASNPRQLINIASEIVDDETVNSRRHKKMKLTLIRIENCELLLIECKDMKRKLDFFEETQITKFIEPNEITDRVNKMQENLLKIISSSCTSEHLPYVMSIQKGRSLIQRIIDFVLPEIKRSILSTEFECLPKFSKSISDDEVNEFINRIYHHLSGFFKQEFLDLLNSQSFDVQPDSISPIIPILFLLVAAQANLPIDETLKSPLSKWIDFPNSKKCDFSKLDRWLLYLTKNDPESIIQLRTYINSFAPKDGTFGDRLLIYLDCHK